MKTIKLILSCDRCHEKKEFVIEDKRELNDLHNFYQYDEEILCAKCAEIEDNITNDNLIPKETIRKFREVSRYDYDIYDEYCPICNKKVGLFNNICLSCGQRLIRMD